jgi:gluconokinase
VTPAATTVPRAAMAIVIMGVAGSGKTTIGLQLAAALGWKFRDADDFHSPQNVAKMSSGQPLSDRDRTPWLAAIRAFLDEALARGESVVVTCSALKQSYRDAIIGDPARVKLVHLAGNAQVILERLGARQGHFMKPEMLTSQLATLEPPQNALHIDITQTPDAIVAQIRQAFAL